MDTEKELNNNLLNSEVSCWDDKENTWQEQLIEFEQSSFEQQWTGYHLWDN